MNCKRGERIATFTLRRKNDPQPFFIRFRRIRKSILKKVGWNVHPCPTRGAALGCSYPPYPCETVQLFGNVLPLFITVLPWHQSSVMHQAFFYDEEAPSSRCNRPIYSQSRIRYEMSLCCEERQDGDFNRRSVAQAGE